MKPSVALNLHREKIRQIVAHYHLHNARVFGSVLEGKDSDGSDLDILVDPSAGTDLFDLGGLQIDLEEQLGVPVDVLTPGDLPARFRDDVLASAILI